MAPLVFIESSEKLMLFAGCDTRNRSTGKIAWETAQVCIKLHKLGL